MVEPSFAQRFGVAGEQVTDDFPDAARVALAYVLDSLAAHDWATPNRLAAEICRAGGGIRTPSAYYDVGEYHALLAKLGWDRVFDFCERVYWSLLHAPLCYTEDVTDEAELEAIQAEHRAEAREYLTTEVNQVLVENNMGYAFVDGRFQRRGRAQTQKSRARLGTVLTQERLLPVRQHVVKAWRFFDGREQADAANCVKEAVCALEASLEVLSGKPASSQFDKTVKQLQGDGPRRIPPALAEAMIKLYAYRGAARGTAHAATSGSRVTELEAELVLNMVASYVTYLADLLSEETEEIPF